jgi:hypothetical protein
MKRLILIHLAVVLLLCVAWTTVIAENDLTAQLWADYHAHFYQTEKIEYYGDNGIRFGGGDDKFVRLYARPSFRYHQTERLRFLAGVGVFYRVRHQRVVGHGLCHNRLGVAVQPEQVAFRHGYHIPLSVEAAFVQERLRGTSRSPGQLNAERFPVAVAFDGRSLGTHI